MSKTSIGWLYILALIAEIILTPIFFSALASIPSASVISQDQAAVQQDQTFIQQDEQGGSNPGSPMDQQLAQDQQKLAQDQGRAGIITVLIFMVIASILGMIAWIGALINLSRGQQWAWFILMFFFSGIMLLIYLIGGPAVPKAGKTPVPQPQASGRQGNTPLATSTQMASPPVPQLQQQSALDVLKLRFARGEIDAATYQQMRDILIK